MHLTSVAMSAPALFFNGTDTLIAAQVCCLAWFPDDGVWYDCTVLRVGALTVKVAYGAPSISAYRRSVEVMLHAVAMRRLVPWSATPPPGPPLGSSAAGPAVAPLSARAPFPLVPGDAVGTGVVADAISPVADDFLGAVGGLPRSWCNCFG